MRIALLNCSFKPNSLSGLTNCRKETENIVSWSRAFRWWIYKKKKFCL